MITATQASKKSILEVQTGLQLMTYSDKSVAGGSEEC